MIRFHHTAISTGNLTRAVAFYRDLFGFEVATEFGWPVATKSTGRPDLDNNNARIIDLAGKSDKPSSIPKDIFNHLPGL